MEVRPVIEFIHDSGLEMVPVRDINIHPENPNDGSVDAISQSIEENGFYGAILAQRSTGFILKGNHSYLAAIQQGATEIPVIWLDVDNTKALEIMAADNNIAAKAVRDPEKLAALLKRVKEARGSVSATSYTEEELKALLSSVQIGRERNTPPPGAEDRLGAIRALTEKWGVQKGQLWEAGEHRLYCGDCLDPESYKRLFGG